MVLIVAALADTRSFAEEVAFLGLRGDHLISACHINSCSTADRALLKKEKQETTSAIEFSVFDFLCASSLQDSQEKNASPVQAEEAKMKARYPCMTMKPGGPEFLTKMLHRGVGPCSPLKPKVAAKPFLYHNH